MEPGNCRKLGEFEKFSQNLMFSTILLLLDSIHYIKMKYIGYDTNKSFRTRFRLLFSIGGQVIVKR